MDPLDIKNLSDQKNRKDNFFPLWLVRSSESDYMAMRFLFFMGVGAFVPSQIMHLGAECLEKIMKAFLQVKMKITLNELKRKYEHNLEEIRSKCHETDSLFNNDVLQQFCKDYSEKKLNEIFRYGLNNRKGGYNSNPLQMIKMVDQFFLQTFIKLDIDSLILMSSIAEIFNQDFLSKIHKISIIPPSKISLIQTAIKQNNLYLDDFLKRITEIKVTQGRTEGP